MNYQKLHDKIIEKARLQSPIGYKYKKTDFGYKEKHHIIPRCLFPKKDPLMNVPENLIYLYPKTHFIIHHLLTKIYPNNNKLRYAFHAMFTAPVNGERNNDLEWKKLSNCRAYEYHRNKLTECGDLVSPEKRKELANNYRGFKHSDETKSLISKANKGRKVSDECRIRISNSHKGVPKSEEHKAKISASHIGKTISEDHRNNIANKLALKYVITHPNGMVETIINLNQFCKKHNINQGNMAKVLKGIKSHHKGYKVRKANL